ncbi:MAG TPA: hypothetical protein VKH34_05845, partial [Vicinamibacterales bacterium]|nr:hypothetical protein [Vicinamibacterales bacterium]
TAAHHLARFTRSRSAGGDVQATIRRGSGTTCRHANVLEGLMWPVRAAHDPHTNSRPARPMTRTARMKW